MIAQKLITRKISLDDARFFNKNEKIYKKNNTFLVKNKTFLKKLLKNAKK